MVSSASPRSAGNMRRANNDVLLRGFFPIEVPTYNPVFGGLDSLESCAVKTMPMCSARGGICVKAMGRTLGQSDRQEVALYRVSAGDELVTCRPGHRDHRQTFDQAGVVVDLRLPAEMTQLARQLAQTRGMGLSVGFENVGGAWRRGKVPGREGLSNVFRMTSADVATVELTAGKDRDPGTQVWLIE
jgi:hypothetical protein